MAPFPQGVDKVKSPVSPGKLSQRLRRLLDNQHGRHQWVTERLAEIPSGSRLLDAGCGSQPYREFCSHLRYFAQDFGEYRREERASLAAFKTGYRYGKLDYIGNIWEIDEKEGVFDAVLCTEVLEHVPFPNETIQELARLLRTGGKLILTAPANCLRHMDPFFFSSGYSDRYLEWILVRSGFQQIQIMPVGSYHAWLMVETARCIQKERLLAILSLWPAFIYHFLRQLKPREKEINTLCFGYHVTAEKKAR
jgi:SAM-dependent methyltransferase